MATNPTADYINQLAQMRLAKPQVAWAPAQFQSRAEVTPSAAGNVVGLQSVPTGEANDTLLSFLPHALGRMIGGGQMTPGHYEVGVDGTQKWVPASLKSKVGDILMGGTGQSAVTSDEIAHQQELAASRMADATAARMKARTEQEAKIAQDMATQGAKLAPTVAAGGPEAQTLDLASQKLNLQQQQKDVELAMQKAQQYSDWSKSPEGIAALQQGFTGTEAMPWAQYMKETQMVTPEGGVGASVDPLGRLLSTAGAMPMTKQESGVEMIPGVGYATPYSRASTGFSSGGVTSIPVNPQIAARVTMSPEAGFARQQEMGGPQPVPTGAPAPGVGATGPVPLAAPAPSGVQTFDTGLPSYLNQMGGIQGLLNQPSAAQQLLGPLTPAPAPTPAPMPTQQQIDAYMQAGRGMGPS